MLCRKEESKHLPIKSFKGIVYGYKVAQGLRHLDIVDIDKAIMHPKSGGLEYDCKGITGLVS